MKGNWTQPLKNADRKQREFLQSSAGQSWDGQVATILTVTAVMLLLQYYAVTYAPREQVLSSLMSWTGLEQTWLEEGRPAWRSPRNWLFVNRIYWVLGQIAVYTIVPILAIKVFFRQSLSEYGLKLRGLFQDAWVYLLMYLTMVPIVWFVSRRESFLSTYPFFYPQEGEGLFPRFIVWELLYAIQFIALEFFFRGFLLLGTERRFGAYAIFVMTIPYCMIHFGKPMLESAAAILAGVILGYMTLRTRSVGMGAMLHIAVAWTMDAVALFRHQQ